LPLVAMICVASPLLLAAPNRSVLQLHTRSREASTRPTEPSNEIHKTVAWDPHKTALVVVDMWDDHWCKGASKRVAELAGPMNMLIASPKQSK
jgi:hypothetical protein